MYQTRTRRLTTAPVVTAALAAVLVAVLTTATLTAGYAASAAAPAAAPAAVTATAAAAVDDPEPGTFTGLGFDACSAPSEAAMQAWLESPYRAVGIYFGGVNRGCAQPNLTASWVANQRAAGWHLIPLYVGLQAPCTTSTKEYRIDPATAAAQGRAEAADAVAQARALGLPEDSVLIFDMEAYRTDDPACRTTVQTFLSAWSARLHDLSYVSGFYSSMASGVADQVAIYESGTLVRPDFVDFARWDNVATVSDPAIPAGYWSPYRRIKQYRGGHNETYGGVTINIDNDYLEVAPLPTTPFGDFTGNGWSDLLSRASDTGRLNLYQGNGSFVTGPTAIGTGWNGMDAIVRAGDFNRDGFEDVIAREAATGYLWLYRGTGTGLGARTRIGIGWKGLREITPVGDLDRDGYPDLVAVQQATGVLRIYRGLGRGLRAAATAGAGWNAMDELTGIGDFNTDGRMDLLARRTSTGQLYLYPGTGLGFGPRVLLGGDWTGMRGLTGVGDFDRDGYPDLLGVQTSSGRLFRYLGAGGRFTTGVVIGTGWGNQNPLA